jgi:hypothetical protein
MPSRADRRSSRRRARARSRVLALSLLAAMLILLFVASVGLGAGDGPRRASRPAVAVASGDPLASREHSSEAFAPAAAGAQNGPQVSMILSSADAPYVLLQDAPVIASSNQAGRAASISVTPTAGASIDTVVLESSPAGANHWTPLNTVTAPSGPGTWGTSVNYADFGTGAGVYDVRAIATQNDGQVGISTTIANVVLVDDENVSGNGVMDYLGLENIGSAVSGSVPLTAALWRVPNNTPDTVKFELSPAGQNNWRTVGTASAETSGGQPVTLNGMQLYTATVDTSSIPDGLYDITVQGQDANGDLFIGEELSQISIDNTSPTVSLTPPGGTLSNDVILRAASSDEGSGIASVKFQYETANSSDWTTIGVISSPPYTQTFDTRSLTNGTYDLRAVATDQAGNTTVSNIVSRVTIANQNPGFNVSGMTITPIVAPATGTQMLGQVAGSADGETWAYGYTNASPAVVDGQPLPYTAPAGKPQLVLLRYTEQTGWQIADVLRNADGTAYPITGQQITVSGAMVGAGDAWLAVTQGSETQLFHRAPGGQFREDATATAAAAPLLSLTSQVNLGVATDGTIYGTLTNTNQSAVTNGGVATKLQYGQLNAGTWTLASASLPTGFTGSRVTLVSMAPTGPQSGWAIFTAAQQSTATPSPAVIGEYGAGGWTYPADTGLDALDLTGNFARSTGGTAPAVTGITIETGSEGVWFEASVGGAANYGGDVIALFDPTTGHVVSSWCAPSLFALSSGCGQPLDSNHPAVVPGADFNTASGPVALGLSDGDLDVYSAGVWSTVAAVGFNGASAGAATFSSPKSGWLAGANAVGMVTDGPPPAPLTTWPAATQHTLTSVALPSGGGSTSAFGALAVGLDGTALHYDPQAGWLVDSVPPAALPMNLLGVAFDGASRAVSVGSFGTILDWNGLKWTEDPQSNSLTANQLNAVAFAPDGEGWAVGSFGTILHYDGTGWAAEKIDAADSGANVTSVAVAGSQVLAIAGSNLITRDADGTWSRVASGSLPASLPPNSMTEVAGLSDGGAVVAGKSFVLERQSEDGNFEFSDQPVQGTAVALAAFRQASGAVGAFVSVAPPPAASSFLGTVFPSGDGDLLVQTSGGWRDLGENQYPANSVPAEGEPEPNPVLAVAPSLDGSAAWVVGGYAGTLTASSLGDPAPLPSIPQAWQTSSIQRYDAGGSAAAPAQNQQAPGQQPVTLPALPDTISFAFFSSALCQMQCASVQNAQPDANLAGAAVEMAAFAAQPGGPAFAMEGGNAVGPISSTAYAAGDGAADLARFGQVMSPLGNLPLYAALGRLDNVPTSTADPLEPWASAFAEQPAPFGSGATPGGITATGSGGTEGSVHRYYSFSVAQNGGTFRVIVLDNSAGSLDASDPGQRTWLTQQLAAAQQANVPVVVFCSEPLDVNNPNHATDADAVANQLAAAGVLGVFTSPGGTSETNRTSLIPGDAASGALQIPEYEGATLGYQQSGNNGVLWYFATVNTMSRTLSVQNIPVTQSIALEPRSGLTVARSSTLLFNGIARRPAGTNASTAQNPVDGYENYVSIPCTTGCSSVTPTYQFSSSVPGVGDFVKAGTNSQSPALTTSGKTTASATSGLFCAFNAGTTVVSVTAGLQTSSLTVTVEPGAVGLPCGTVNYPPDDQVIQLPGKTLVQSSSSGPNDSLQSGAPNVKPVVHVVVPKVAVAPPPPSPAVVPVVPSPVAAVAPAVVHHHPPPPPVSHPPTPTPPPPFIVAPTVFNTVSPALTPPLPPPVTPVPPGGAVVPGAANAQANASAKREEKARKEASQSAYVIRPAGASAEDWFYPVVGVMTVFAVALIGGGVRPGRRPSPAFVRLTEIDETRRGRRSR